MGSEESQAFDTVQFCLQRKAAAGAEDGHGSLTRGSLAATKKARCPQPGPKSSTGSQKALSSICSTSLVPLGKVGVGARTRVLVDTLVQSAWSVKNTDFGAR